ncbi:hypothetical protein [Phenylobacterium sp.]|uniref:hypothetical protein n=1 Tax=Phenylobacterium sp. TaxID=1871053 RepID=UPI0025FF1DE1|nr:hypothetical protein [Phenylobacterium sp.]MBX3485190.1 hypothetical protein [Phenylobacterium sp.]MCW5761519.1 hypothetical protein [Phenylobacterium sp.]
MAFRLAPLLAGLACAFGAGAALASDYMVVTSSDPAFARGQGFDAGARVALGAGQKLTLMHASGDLVTLRGAAGGVTLPRRMANQAEADRLAILKVMVAPAARQMVGSTRTRSGICPSPESLTSLDAIVQVQAAGCRGSAGEALETWLASHEPQDP